MKRINGTPAEAVEYEDLGKVIYMALKMIISRF